MATQTQNLNLNLFENTDRLDKDVYNENFTIIDESFPFKLGIDDEGNYGYYKAGADTVTPFKSGGVNFIGGFSTHQTQIGIGYEAAHDFFKATNFSRTTFIIPSASNQPNYNKPWEIQVKFCPVWVEIRNITLTGGANANYQNPSVQLHPTDGEIWCGYSTDGRTWNNEIRISVPNFVNTISTGNSYFIVFGWTGLEYYAKLLNSEKELMYEGRISISTPHANNGTQFSIGNNNGGTISFLGSIDLLGCYIKNEGEVVWGTDELPSQRKVKWLQNNGSYSWIDTGYKPTNNTKVEMKVYGCESAAYFFGCWNEAYNIGAYAVGNDRTEVYAGYGNQGGAQFSPVITDGEHLIVMDKNNIYVDGELKASLTPNTFSVQYSLFLFAQNRKGTAGWNATDGQESTKMKIGFCKIYENDVLQKHFEAALDPNGLPCMLEKIAGTYHYNAGSKAFTYAFEEG